MAGSTWLADTSVFYWAGSDQKIRKIKGTGVRVITCVSSIYEIFSEITNPELFSKRQRALRSLNEICGIDGIMLTEPDGKIAEAFGQQAEEIPRPMVEATLAIGLCAKDVEDISKRYFDRNTKSVFRLDPKELQLWDIQTGKSFKNQIMQNYSKPLPWLKTLAEEMGYSGHDASDFAKKALSTIVKLDDYRAAAFCGLASRAGLISAKDLKDALEDESLQLMKVLKQRAEAVYDYSLEGYLDIYSEYSSYCARKNRTGGDNDLLDLEPLVYFDKTDPHFFYASGEKLWAGSDEGDIGIVRTCFPDRAIYMDDFFKS